MLALASTYISYLECIQNRGSVFETTKLQLIDYITTNIGFYLHECAGDGYCLNAVLIRISPVSWVMYDMHESLNCSKTFKQSFLFPLCVCSFE